ncbi:hypothetical protein J4E81_005576 [Alternaria sp. BMP 2799]|nr:hypothetical protein J4E81_005576 [Alternaria sp. BMP 2799]
MHQSQGRQGIACGEGNSKAWVTDPGSTSKKLFHTYGIARSTAGIRSKPKYDQFSIRLDPLPGPFHQWCKADEDRLGLLEWIRQHRELEDAPLNDPDCRYVAGRQDVAERYVRFLSADAERKNSSMPRREDLQRRAEQNVRHGFPFIKDMRGDLGNNTWTDACNQSRWLPPDLLRDGMWVQVVHTIEVSNAKKRIGERWVPRDWHVKVHLYSIHVINEPFVPEVAELYTLSGFEYRPPSPEPATAAVSSGNASAPGASSNPAMDIVSSGSSKSWSTPVPPQDTDGDFDEEDIDDDAMMSTTTAKGKGKGKAKAIEMNDTDDFPSYDTPGMSQQSYNLPSRQNSPFGSPTPHQTPGSSTGIRLGGF